MHGSQGYLAQIPKAAPMISIASKPVLACLLICLFAINAEAQVISTPWNVVANPGFDNGSTGWFKVGTGNVGSYTSASLNKGVLLSGDVWLKQSFVIPAGTKAIQASVTGFRSGISNPSSEGGFAGIGVSYFDVNWNYLTHDSAAVQHNVGKTSPFREFLGTIVPKDAVNVQIWLRSSDDTQAGFDDVKLVLANNVDPKNFIIDSIGVDFYRFSGRPHPSDSFGNRFLPYGIEFSSAGKKRLRVNSDGATASVLLQNLTIDPTKKYKLTYGVQGARGAAALGVDFFDVSGNKIAGYYDGAGYLPESTAPRSAVQHTLAIPAVPGAKTAGFWIWVDAQAGGVDSSLLLEELSLQIVP